VRIKLSHSGGWLRLSVIDDGVGISTLDLESSRSFGIMGMRERTQVFGGNVDIQCGEKGGTQVKVSIPLTANNRELDHV
jgi:signal transduction histidine kinase